MCVGGGGRGYGGGSTPELRRDRRVEVVVRKFEIRQLCECRQLRRNAAAQVVTAEVEPLQGPQSTAGAREPGLIRDYYYWQAPLTDGTECRGQGVASAGLPSW